MCERMDCARIQVNERSKKWHLNLSVINWLLKTMLWRRLCMHTVRSSMNEEKVWGHVILGTVDGRTQSSEKLMKRGVKRSLNFIVTRIPDSHSQSVTNRPVLRIQANRERTDEREHRRARTRAQDGWEVNIQTNQTRWKGSTFPWITETPVMGSLVQTDNPVAFPDLKLKSPFQIRNGSAKPSQNTFMFKTQLPESQNLQS